MPRNLSEADRKKNQFDKEERVHLLAIMKQYAPLLDKSASTLARKKIWTTIEDEFKQAGFTRKTSAQLKKYWQNYKYHCKKASAFGKENKRFIDPDASESLQWNRCQVFVENRTASKFSEIPRVVRSLTDRLQRSPTETGCHSEQTFQDNGESSWKLNNSDILIDLSRVKTERNDDETIFDDSKAETTNPLEGINLEEDSLDEKKEIFAGEDHFESSSSLNATDSNKSKNRIVVSNAKICNNSVTVSVIYPENNDSQFLRSEIDRRFERCSSSVSLPTGRSDGEDRKSFECNEKDDLSREKEMEEFSKENREFVTTESDENDANSDRMKRLETRNDRLESRSYVFLTDYHNRLKHRLLLQQLEMEEKRLKVKIAEMAIQEVQLRIKALSEDMRRTEELHQLRLANVAAANLSV